MEDVSAGVVVEAVAAIQVAAEAAAVGQVLVDIRVAVAELAQVAVAAITD